MCIDISKMDIVPHIKFHTKLVSGEKKLYVFQNNSLNTNLPARRGEMKCGTLSTYLLHRE
jgi:hypothetical protein